VLLKALWKRPQSINMSKIKKPVPMKLSTASPSKAKPSLKKPFSLPMTEKAKATNIKIK